MSFIKTEFCDFYNKGGGGNTKKTQLFPYFRKCPPFLIMCHLTKYMVN